MRIVSKFGEPGYDLEPSYSQLEEAKAVADLEYQNGNVEGIRVHDGTTVYYELDIYHEQPVK